MSARPPGYHEPSEPVAVQSEQVCAEFLTRTYLHLAGAILAFTLLAAPRRTPSAQS